jgi:hypothetical protein
MSSTSAITNIIEFTLKTTCFNIVQKKRTEALDRRKFLSKSFKVIVSASMVIMATKVPAYEQYLGEDSTNVDTTGYS